MRLKLVTGTPFKIHCLNCKQWKSSGPRTLADLDGPAFAAYYCDDCYSIIAPKFGDMIVKPEFNPALK